jgi:hypothetical protein
MWFSRSVHGRAPFLGSLALQGTILGQLGQKKQRADSSSDA